MKNKCFICQKEFENDGSLHRHLKAHKISTENYYKQFFPRFDLLTREPIPFKTVEQYFETDFLTRESLAVWFKQQLLDTQKDYIIKFLLKFKVKRGNLAPNQVELRSLITPSVLTCEKVFNKPFDILCEELGFIKRYNYAIKPAINKNQKIKITIDTREQQELFISNAEILKSKLDIGDITGREEFYSGIFIERKSGSDFISTFSELERFEREIQRARELNTYIVVLIEESYDKMLHFEKFFEHGKPALVWHNIRYLSRKYDNLQFLFVKNRIIAAQMVKNIILMGREVKNLDLQYLLDKNLI